VKIAAAFTETNVRCIEADASATRFHDMLAVEEPLEIRVGFCEKGNRTHRAISITMRTPGDDAELAAGFFFTEGIIKSPEQVSRVRHCGLKIGNESGPIERVGSLNSNTIRVDLNDGVELDLDRLKRHFYTSSSCGVCGKSSIEALQTGAKKIPDDKYPRVESEVIHRIPDVLRESQDIFNQTGGLHASALFDTKGELEGVREDVGRHNALDKVIGARFLAGEIPLSDKILLVSGRASFELVQKALMAGIPILAAVGAPSSLAVELAAEFGMSLIGFVRDGRFNIYCGAERII
jgi:FdhD protein